MYDSVMWKYIQEEKDLLSNQLKTDLSFKIAKYLTDIESVYITAHGSSYNAACSTVSFFQEITKIKAYVYTPADFIYKKEMLKLESRSKTLIIGISQTGTSNGVINALKMAKGIGFKVLSITSLKNSPVDKLGDWTLFLPCGDEKSNAKTKGYSATLLLLLQFAYSLGLLKRNIDDIAYQSFIYEIQDEIAGLANLKDKVVRWCLKNNFGKDMKYLYVIGNGIHYGTAMEGMLKLMETMCIPAMFSDIIEFSHGMHRSLHEDAYVILIKNKQYAERIERTFCYLKEKHVKVIMLNVCDDTENDESIFNVPLYQRTDSLLSVVMIIQILSVFTPEINGLDPNRESNNEYTKYMQTRV